MMAQETRSTSADENRSEPLTGECISCSPVISIFVKNGTAIISGTVCSDDDIAEAEDAVSLMSGIDQVFNLAKSV